MSARKLLRGTAFAGRVLAAVLAGAVLTAAATALLPLLLPGLAWKALRERRARPEPHLRPLPEREARRLLRMPVGHPESLTAELPPGDEEWLGDACAALWPDDEWTDIANLYRDERTGP